MTTDTKQALEAVVGLVGEITDGDYLSRLANGHVIASQCAAVIRDQGPALLAALEDARRYRWLRGVSGPAVIHWYDKSADDGLALGALDRAIDDAMAAGGG